MKTYGLIGFPLEHSFSKNYFSKKFIELNLSEQVYENFPLQDLKQFSDLIKNNSDLIGLNITIPYKQSILSYLDEMSDEAKEIGAVNTIKIIRNSGTIHLKGFNTDVYGFSLSLKPFLKNIHQRALILGNGGAAQAVKFVLKNLGIDFIQVSRTSAKNTITYDQLNEYILKSHLLIVNTTPLGMSPNVETFPDLPYHYLTEDHLLYDLVYNPEKTIFLKRGEEKGALCLNGMSMLKLQAEKSWEIWNSN